MSVYKGRIFSQFENELVPSWVRGIQEKHRELVPSWERARSQLVSSLTKSTFSSLAQKLSFSFTSRITPTRLRPRGYAQLLRFMQYPVRSASIYLPKSCRQNIDEIDPEVLFLTNCVILYYPQVKVPHVVYKKALLFSIVFQKPLNVIS